MNRRREARARPHYERKFSFSKRATVNWAKSRYASSSYLRLFKFRGTGSGTERGHSLECPQVVSIRPALHLASLDICSLDPFLPCFQIFVLHGRSRSGMNAQNKSRIFRCEISVRAFRRVHSTQEQISAIPRTSPPSYPSFIGVSKQWNRMAVETLDICTMVRVN